MADGAQLKTLKSHYYTADCSIAMKFGACVHYESTQVVYLERVGRVARCIAGLRIKGQYHRRAVGWPGVAMLRNCHIFIALHCMQRGI